MPDFRVPTLQSVINIGGVRYLANNNGIISVPDALAGEVLKLGGVIDAGGTPPPAPSAGGDSGIVKIGSVSDITDVAYVDIALPAEYDSFQLVLRDASISAGYDLCFVVSTDGGVTWLNDHANWDSYKQRTALDSGGADGGYNIPVGALDQQLVASSNDCSNGYVVEILPGDNGRLFSLLSTAVFSAAGNLLVNIVATTANINATITPIAARIDVIRIGPFGNGDLGSDTSSDTISIGSYILYGRKV